MQLLRHEQTGRTYTLADEGKPEQRVWSSRIGERNVDVNGDGSAFAPYALSGGSLRHGDAECSFESGWQTLRKLGQVLVSKSRIYIQRETSPGVWIDVPHGLPTFNLTHNYPSEGKCTAYLDFPNMQGYVAGARFQVGVEVGGNDLEAYGFRMRSPVAGTFRLEWVLEIPEDVNLAWIDAPTSHSDPTPIHVGARVGSTAIRWAHAEAPFRSATVESDGQGGKIVHLFLGPYPLAAMQWLAIYPDTWGPTNIAADEDDGDEDVGGTWNANGHYPGVIQIEMDNDLFTIRWVGLRWNVTLPAGVTAIGAGTKIACPAIDDYDSATTLTLLTRAVESATPAVWSTTKPSAVADWTEASNSREGVDGALDIDVQSIVSELVVTNGYNYASGAYMNFGVYGSAMTANGWWSAANDYGSGSLAALTIVYTPAAAGGLSIPVAMHYMRMRRVH